MKTIAKLATGVILACSLATAATVPASAGVRFSVGLGAPVVAPTATYSCYDAYGNYISTSPYCSEYPAPYAAPSFNLTFGGRDRDRGEFHDRDRDHGRAVSHSFDRGDRGDHGSRGRDRG